MSDIETFEPTVDIEIGGKAFTMKPTFRALSNIEKELGMGIIGFVMKRVPSGVDDMRATLDMKLDEMITIIFHGIKGAGQEPPTREKIGEAIVRDQVNFIAHCINFLGSSFQSVEGSTNNDTDDSEEDKKK